MTSANMLNSPTDSSPGDEVDKPGAESGTCKLCESTTRTLDIDTVHEIDNVQVHYFCLLFSSGLGQRGIFCLI